MTPHHQDERPNLEAEEEASRMSRRTILRRSALGFTGLVLAPLLAACGDEDDPEEAVDELNDPPDDPNIAPEEPGLDAPNDDIEDDSPDADGDGGG